MHSHLRDLIRLESHLSMPLWGGHILASDYGRGDDRGVTIGESWEIYAGNRVIGGASAGKTLQDLTAEWGEELLGVDGARHASGHFPLLIKLIDASQDLSIQVHPNDEQAKRMEGQPFGKTEAWHILRATPGASLVYGLKHALTPEALRNRAADGSIELDLASISVHTGDSVLVPAGTIHAIGAGIFLYEVQETSETTYRLYDWNRRGPDGKTRELHLEKAAAVAKLEPSPPALTPWHPSASGISTTEVVRCDYFRLERADLTQPLRRSPGGRSFEALTVISGAIGVHGPDATQANEEVTAGQSVLVPASCTEYHIEPTDGISSVLIASVPGS